MKLIKVAAAVLNQTALDWEGNRDRIVSAIRAARDQQVSILCLPELCITGYGCEDAFQSTGVQQMAQRVLMEIVPETTGIVVSLGLPIFHRGAIYNTACLVSDQRLRGLVGKKNLANEGIHYEPRWFKAWPAYSTAEITIDGDRYPLGDLIFECGGLSLGFEICEDAWVGNRPGLELARHNVDFILNPSASHFAFGKHEIRKRFVLEGSRAFHAHYIYANLLGNEAGRAIYDGDAMIASDGKMAAIGPRFSYQDFSLTTAVVDLDATRMSQARAASGRSDDQSSTLPCIASRFSFPPEVALESSELKTPSWETGPAVKEEEFTRAVALGLFDYLRKSRSRGFVVSLSGGADSAAVATLAALSVDFGVGQLGAKRFTDKLAHIGTLPAAMTNRDRVACLLTCVYQATRNSSATTNSAAAAVANEVGARFLHFDVDNLVQDYVSVVAKAIGRPLTWERDDIALQNIQARARAPGVWLLANLNGALLLSTSNRSEAAVGYATMDGDTSGGLAPIAGIDKAFLRRWLVWMETTGPSGLRPFPSLNKVNQQQPTAELRPQSFEQTDEGDLMPYDILDAIERAAIRDKLVPAEVYLRLMAEHADVTPQQLVEWIERFFRLWSRNQWKRERYAPSFHLDDENLDPKTWCRFPILSGGFERELAELRAAYADGSESNKHEGAGP